MLAMFHLTTFNNVYDTEQETPSVSRYCDNISNLRDRPRVASIAGG